MTRLPRTDIQLFFPPPAEDFKTPELGMCQLTAYLKRAGFSARQTDLNVLFRGACGTEGGMDAAMPLAWVPPRRRARGLWNGAAPEYRVDRVLRAARSPAAAYREFFRVHALPLVRDARMIGLSVVTADQLVAGLCLAGEIRARHPGKPICLGGPWANASWEALERWPGLFDFVDGIVAGPGELPLAGLLRRERDIPGLARRVGGRVVRSGLRAGLRIGELPAPDFSGLPLDLYPERRLPYQTTSGCEWGRCLFCSHVYSRRAVESKAKAAVAAELGMLSRRYGVKEFDLADTTTPVRVMRDLAEGVRKGGLDVSWHALSRASDGLPPAVLRALAAGGCRSLRFGLETADQPELDRLNKGISLRTLRRNLRGCREAGIRAGVFVLSYPGQSREGLRRTLRYVSRNSGIISTLIPERFRMARWIAGTCGMPGRLAPDAWKDLDSFDLPFLAKGVARGEFQRLAGPLEAAIKGGTLPRAGARPAQRPKALVIGISRDLNGDRSVLPLAGGLLKTYADAKLGRRCAVRTLNLFDFEADAALGPIAAWKPDIVAFSCYLWNAAAVESLCRKIRKKHPRLRIVLGGPEASGRGAELLERCRADALVVGEGEAAFAELLARRASGQDWDGVPGVLARTGAGLRAGPPRPVLDDLDGIPSPYHDAPAALGLRGRRSRFHTLETMRGCPNKCSYCLWTNLRANKLRYFSDERVAYELRWIAEHTPRSWVFVADSDLFLDHRRALRLAPLFHGAARRGGCEFIFQTNIAHWDERLMRAWDSASFQLNVGVNSITPAAQAILGRRQPKALVEEKLRRMRAAAPKTSVRIQMMFAAPGETFAEFCAAFDWAWFQPAAFRQFFHTQPLYGTPMRERAAELGLRCREAPPYYITETRECSAEQIRTEDLMVMFVPVWMADPQSRRTFTDLADSRFQGSLAKAFLGVWKGTDASVRSLALKTWERFSAGRDWSADDFQVDHMRRNWPPATARFRRAVLGALPAAG